MTSLVPVLLLALSLAAAPDEEPLRRVDVASVRPDLLAAELRARGFDVLGADARAVDLVVSAQERRVLEAEGYALTVTAVGRPLADAQRAAATQEGAQVPAGYPALGEVEATLAGLAAAHPTRARVVDLTATYGTPTTAEGRHVLALVVSDDVTVEEDEPAALLVSAHHSREVVTPLIAIEVAARLLAGYGTDPDATAIVDGQETWIVPVQNPDGYVHVFTVDDFWRKNRRVFPTGVGVDLNRNYPPGWGGGCGGSTSVGSSTYQGPAPASEPETLTLIALSDHKHFARVLDFHSFAQETRYGYGCWSHPLDAFLQAEAAVISQDAGWGGATGSSCCLGGEIHHQMQSGAHAFLLETATAFQPPFVDGQAEAVAVADAAVQFLRRELSLSGHVRDVGTGLPVEATITASGVVFPNGESFRSAGDFGRWHAVLPAGGYDLRFTAPGYATAVVPVTVQLGTPVLLDVDLAPLAPAWTDLGGGSPGALGTPQLAGTGSLAPSTPVALDLVGAVPGAVLLGWLSATSAPLPLAGGTLHAWPVLNQFLFLANGAGQLHLTSTWPPGLPPGTEVWVQFLCEDGTTPDGFVLSNALRGTTP